MSQLYLIEKLEKQIGFTYHRLNCDGNYYAECIRSGALERAMEYFAIGCQLFKESIKFDRKMNPDGAFEKTEYPSTMLDMIKESQRRMNSFDLDDYKD